MAAHSETCRMVTKKLLTGTDRDCDCGVVYDDMEASLKEACGMVSKLQKKHEELITDHVSLLAAAGMVCNTRYSNADWDKLDGWIGELCNEIPPELLNRRAGGTMEDE